MCVLELSNVLSMQSSFVIQVLADVVVVFPEFWGCELVKRYELCVLFQARAVFLLFMGIYAL